MRGVVRNDEQRVLSGADQDDAGDYYEDVRPEGQCNGRGERNNENVRKNRGGRAPRRASRELKNDFSRQRFAEIVLELLAVHCTPPINTYLISRYSSMPYLEPSRPRPDDFTP